MFELNSLETNYDPYSNLYRFNGYQDATSFRLVLKKQLYEVDVVLCDHTVPTLSYCFSEVKMKLREEYAGALILQVILFQLKLETL